MLEIPEDWRDIAETSQFVGAREAVSAQYDLDKHLLLSDCSHDVKLLLWHVGPSNISASLGTTMKEEMRGEVMLHLLGYFRPPPLRSHDLGIEDRAHNINLLFPEAWSANVLRGLHADQHRALVDMAFSRRQDLIFEDMNDGRISAHALLLMQRRLDDLQETYRIACRSVIRRRDTR